MSPSFSATVYPYVYSFVAAYVGNNVDPRPFPIWVRAVDTSTNASNVVQVAMVVLPNTDPSGRDGAGGGERAGPRHALRGVEAHRHGFAGSPTSTARS